MPIARCALFARGLLLCLLVLIASVQGQQAYLNGTLFRQLGINTEADISLSNQSTLIIELTGTTFQAGVATTTNVISGCTGTQGQWDALVLPAITAADISQVSATEILVEIPMVPDYYIIATENVTCAIPDASVVTPVGTAVGVVTIPDDVGVAVTGGYLRIGNSTELDIREGGRTIEIEFTSGDRWHPTIGADNNATKALIQGIRTTFVPEEPEGWNVKVLPTIDHTHVNRVSAKLVRITLPAVPSYSIIGSQETISVSIAAECVEGVHATIAGPPLVVKQLPRADLLGNLIVNGGIPETALTVGSPQLLIQLFSEQWQPTVGDENTQNLTQLLLDGMSLTSTQEQGWAKYVEPTLGPLNFERTSDAVVTLKFPQAYPEYVLNGGNETIALTVHPWLLVGTNALVASPNILILDVPGRVNMGGTFWSQRLHVLESEIIAGGLTMSFTLEGTSWKVGMGENNTITDGLLASITSVTVPSELYGWNGIVTPVLTHAHVNNQSRLVATITLPPFPNYVITKDETIRVTVAAVTNDEGSVLIPSLREMKIRNQGPPDPPVPQMEQVTALTTTVSWTVPNDNSVPITGYEVHLAGPNTPLAEVAAIPTGQETKYKITGLNPATNYQVVIKAINALGPSVSNQILGVRTLSFKPRVFEFKPPEVFISEMTTVTLVGELFGQTKLSLQEVKVGGVDCKNGLQWVSETEIICDVGPVAAAGDVTAVVKTTDLGEGPESPEVLHMIKPFPFVASVSPTEGWADPYREQKIVFTGRYLGQSASDVTKVTMNGFPCHRYDYISSKEIHCYMLGIKTVGGGFGQVTTNSLGKGKQGTTLFTFKPVRPTITSITPTFGWTTESVTLSITGEYLGANYSDIAQVTVAGIQCRLVPGRSYVNQQSINCEAGPSGTPKAGPVQVTTRSGGLGPLSGLIFTFSQPAPTVTSVTPSFAWSGVTTVVKIQGFFLGTSKKDIQRIFFIGVDCVNQAFYTSPNEIGCRLPLWPSPTSGKVQVWTFSRGAGRVSEFLFEVRKPVPVVEAITPLRGPSIGGTKITLSGVYLGASKSDILDITMNGKSCVESKTWTSETLIGCTSPRHTGTGPVRVTTRTHGQGPASALQYYFVPTADVEIYSIYPSKGALTGGARMTIRGRGLGDVKEDILELWVGNVSCLDTVWHTDNTRLGCTIPPNVAGYHEVTATVNTHRAVRKVKSPVDYSYLPVGLTEPPPLVAVTHPLTGPVSGGTEIVIGGINLGLNWFDVRFISAAGIPCAKVTYHDSRTIGCITAPAPVGTTGKILVRSRSGGWSKPYGNFTYEYPASSVDAMTPLVLPVKGGAVTIRGEHFGWDNSTLDVFFGASKATNVTWRSEKELLAVVPPRGSYSSLYGVAVTVDGKPGGFNTRLFVQYVKDSELCLTPCSFNSFCKNLTCACMDGYTNAPVCDRRAVALEPTPELYTSEEGHDVNITYTLSLKPSTDVVVLVTSTDSGEGRPVPSSLTFTSENYQTPQTVRIIPQRDAYRDGNSTYAIHSRVSTLDRRFKRLPLPTVDLESIDSLAKVTLIEPAILNSTGGRVTIHAHNLDQQIYVYFNGELPLELQSGRKIELTQPIVKTLLQTSTRAPSVSAEAAADASIYLVKEKFDVTVPSSSKKGYNDVWVVNGNGDIGVYRDLYMTDDCAVEGRLFVDGECKPCPSGGICPGGDRVWPKYGYWNTDEFSGYVRECDPRERCLGGRVPQCAPTFEGKFCGACVENHYKAFGNCLKCPSIIEGLIRLGAVYGLWILFAILALWPENPLVTTYGALAWSSLQIVRQLGSMGSIHMPEWVKRAYLGLQMFSGDIEALLPDCFYAANHGQTYAYALIFVMTLSVPLLIGGFIGWRILLKSSRFISPTALQTAQTKFKDRFFRSLNVFAFLVYLPVCTLVISTVACFRESSVGRWYMMTNPAVRCYRPLDHMMMSLASAIIMIVFVLGVPARVAWQLWKYRAEMVDSRRFQLRFGFWFQTFKPGRLQGFWFLLDFVGLFIVANYGTSLRSHPASSMVVGGLFFFLQGMCFLIFRPFKEWFMAFIRAVFIISYLVIISMNYYLSVLVLEDETGDNNAAAAAANDKLRNTIGRVSSSMFLVVLFMMGFTLLGVVTLMMFLILAPSRVPAGVFAGFKVDSDSDESYFSDFMSDDDEGSSGMESDPEAGILSNAFKSAGLGFLFTEDKPDDVDGALVATKSTDALLAESNVGSEIATIARFLDKIPILEPLSGEEKILLAESMKPAGYTDGEDIITQGARGDDFFIVMKGMVKVVIYSPKDKKKKNGKQVAVLKKGDFFGEQALITDNPRGASVVAIGTVKCVTCNRDDFVYHLGPVLDDLKAKMLERQAQSNANAAQERSEAQVKLYLRFLSKVPVLAPLTRSERVELAKGLTPVTFHNDELIIRQGDIGDKFYVIERGAAKVYVRDAKTKGKSLGEEVAELHRGRYFGEQALLTDNPRGASVVAFGKCKCVSVDRDLFRRLLGPIEDLLKNEILDRDSSNRNRAVRLYQRFLNQVPLLSSLTRDEKAELASGMMAETYRDGEYIITQGELGDALYIIEKGMCRVTIQKKLGKAHRKKANEVAVLERGDFFGEKALVTDNPRGANVIAYGDCVCAVIDRATFTRLLGPVEDVLRETIKARDAGGDGKKKSDEPNAIAQLYLEFLGKIPLLSPLTVKDKFELAQNMTPLNFQDGEYVLRQGEVGDEFYIIEAGECRVNIQDKPGKGKGKDVAVLKTGQYFGEQALITDNPRAANIIAQGFCNVAVVDRATFTRVLGPIEDVLKEEIRRRDMTEESYESVYEDSD